jgi:hypothetical protein
MKETLKPGIEFEFAYRVPDEQTVGTCINDSCIGETHAIQKAFF